MSDDYAVIEKHKLEHLIADVRAALANGWFPAGGIAVSVQPLLINGHTGPPTITYHQALVKLNPVKP